MKNLADTLTSAPLLALPAALALLGLAVGLSWGIHRLMPREEGAG